MSHNRWKAGALAVFVCCALAVAVIASIPPGFSFNDDQAALPQGQALMSDRFDFDHSEQTASASSGAAAAGSANSSEANPGVWYEGAPEFEEGFVLADLAAGVTADEALAVFAADERLSGVGVVRETDDYVKLSLPEGLGVEEAVGLLRATDVVGSAQPNYTYYLMEDFVEPPASGAGRFEPSLLAAAQTADLVAGTRLGDALGVQITPNDPRFSEQWGMVSAQLPGAWDLLEAGAAAEAGEGDAGEGQSDDPVIIAVIDQGFQVEHPDLAGNVVDSYDAALGREGASGVYATHGTHVAGIVGAETNNGVGVAGATFNQCKMMLISLVRYDAAQGKYTMSTDTLVDAYTHVLEYKAAGHDVRVVNLSVGDPREDPSRDEADIEMYDAIQKAHDAGILTVAAACNTGSGFDRAPFYAYPSDFEQVVSVINLQRSSNADGVERSSGSNYNMPDQLDKDISAPGGSILSTYPGSTYAYSNGTSMACPLVAGVAGLVFSAHPQMTPDEVASKLYSTAKDLTKTQGATAGWDRVTGYGEVNAAAAVSDEAPYLTCKTLLETGETMSCEVKVGGVAQTGWTWASSDPDVARVGSDGVIRGIFQGQAVISATRNGVSAYQTLTVQGPADMSDRDIAISVEDQVYTGVRRLPVPEVRDGDVRLVMNTHFTASWSDNLNAGTGTVTITGIGAYTGQLSQAFTIAKAPIRNAEISAYPTSIQADGTPKVPTVVVRDIDENAGKVLQQGADYTLSGIDVAEDTVSVVITATEGCRNFTGSVEVEIPLRPEADPVYRLYNPNTGEHHYTLSGGERDHLIEVGWRGEGVGWYAPRTGAQAVHRLYNPNAGVHHYTVNDHERDYLVGLGWNSEGDLCPSAAGIPGAVPLYRSYSPYDALGSHNYTTSYGEHSYLLRIGWQDEGTAWYGFTE